MNAEHAASASETLARVLEERGVPDDLARVHVALLNMVEAPAVDGLVLAIATSAYRHLDAELEEHYPREAGDESGEVG